MSKWMIVRQRFGESPKQWIGRIFDTKQEAITILRTWIGGFYHGLDAAIIRNGLVYNTNDDIMYSGDDIIGEPIADLNKDEKFCWDVYIYFVEQIPFRLKDYK